MPKASWLSIALCTCVALATACADEKRADDPAARADDPAAVAVAVAVHGDKASATTDTRSAAPTPVDTSRKPPNKAAGTTEMAPALPEKRELNFDERGRALRGYDPVAYHTTGKPTAGVPEHIYEWNNARWMFASADHRAAFEQAPDKYAPANGGFCTFGVVLGKKFDGDPEVWHVSDGHLYVFLNEEVKGKFLQDEAGNLSRVQANWPEIADKTPAELAR